MAASQYYKKSIEEQNPHLLKVIEVLVHPVLEHVEDPELNGLTVLLPEALHVLRHLDLRLLVAELRVRL